MSGVDAEHGLEVAAADDQQPVETFGADGSYEALGVGVRLRRADRSMDDLDTFAAEDLIEGGGELAVAVVDQKSHPLEQAGEAEIARLLGHPGAARVGRAACQMHAAASELDEEEHVEAAQRERLDGEEIAGEHAGGLLAQELPPARPRTSRSRRKTVGKEDTPDRARRHTEAELAQLAG